MRTEEGGNPLVLSRELSLFERSAVVKWLIGVAFFLFLFCFLHLREASVDTLDVDTVAQRYVVAQANFSFYDEEATQLLRQEAVRDIGKIYELSEQDIAQAKNNFEQYLLNHQEWRTQVSSTTFEEMYKAIAPLDKTLTQVRFTNMRTLRKMHEAHFDTSGYWAFSPEEGGENGVFPDAVWDFIRSHAYENYPASKAATDFIIRYFKRQPWELIEDLSLQRSIRDQIQKLVPPQYTSFQAGQRIISAGEHVTPRHVAMMQAMKQALTKKRELWQWETLSGTFLLTLLLIGISVSFFKLYCTPLLSSNRKLLLLTTVTSITLLLAKLFEFVMLNVNTDIADLARFPLFSLFPAVLLCSLLSSMIAGYTAVFCTVVLTLTLSIAEPNFLLLNIVAATVATASTRSLKRRNEIFVVCAQTWCVCAALIIALLLYEGDIGMVSTLIDVASAFFFAAATAILILGSLPLLEMAFHVLTDATLIEYMDPNHPLLRRLAIEAPGTYQHSVVVANLSEAAAHVIGANGLFCRAASLYHDIGKVSTPQYFTENQQSGINIHQLLTPLESAQVILTHVPEGVSLARKAKLPEPFIDIIQEHHGTTLVYYFYRKAVEQYGEARAVNEQDYRYKGPKPRTRESALIMLADSFEAASRSLEEVNQESLTRLMASLVSQKIEDKQLDECSLTFFELQQAQSAMVKALMVTAHARTKYPAHKKEKELAVLCPV